MSKRGKINKVTSEVKMVGMMNQFNNHLRIILGVMFSSWLVTLFKNEEGKKVLTVQSKQRNALIVSSVLMLVTELYEKKEVNISNLSKLFALSYLHSNKLWSVEVTSEGSTVRYFKTSDEKFIKFLFNLVNGNAFYNNALPKKVVEAGVSYFDNCRLLGIEAINNNKNLSDTSFISYYVDMFGNVSWGMLNRGKEVRNITNLNSSIEMFDVVGIFWGEEALVEGLQVVEESIENTTRKKKRVQKTVKIAGNKVFEKPTVRVSNLGSLVSLLEKVHIVSYNSAKVRANYWVRLKKIEYGSNVNNWSESDIAKFDNICWTFFAVRPYENNDWINWFYFRGEVPNLDAYLLSFDISICELKGVGKDGCLKSLNSYLSESEEVKDKFNKDWLTRLDDNKRYALGAMLSSRLFNIHVGNSVENVTMSFEVTDSKRWIIGKLLNDFGLDLDSSNIVGRLGINNGAYLRCNHKWYCMPYRGNSVDGVSRYILRDTKIIRDILEAVNGSLYRYSEREQEFDKFANVFELFEIKRSDLNIERDLGVWKEDIWFSYFTELDSSVSGSVERLLEALVWKKVKVEPHMLYNIVHYWKMHDIIGRVDQKVWIGKLRSKETIGGLASRITEVGVVTRKLNYLREAIMFIKDNTNDAESWSESKSCEFRFLLEQICRPNWGVFSGFDIWAALEDKSSIKEEVEV